MKQILFISFLLFACMACEEKVDRYVGESGIYFDTEKMASDTIFVPWGLKNSSVQEQDLTLKVCLMGEVVPYDRSFKIEVVTDEADTLKAVENVDYRSFPTDCRIAANEAETRIEIKLLRTEDLLKRAKRFTVRLVENEELKFLYTRERPVVPETPETPGEEAGDQEIPEAGGEEVEEPEVEMRPLDYQRVIYMDERFKVPNWWPVCGRSIFGDYSAKKCILICDVMGIDREAFVAPFSMTNTISQGYLSYVGKYMHRWLQENPQFEDDGKPMEMGTASRN